MATLVKRPDRVVEAASTAEYEMMKMKREFDATISRLEARIAVLEQRDTSNGHYVPTGTS